MEDLELIKKQIIKVLKAKEFEKWDKCKLLFVFPPYINMGHTGSQFFWDKEGNKVRNILFLDDEAINVFFKFVVKNNQDNNYNTIIFETEYNDYENATIEISFNQEVEDTFQNNLPKSKRGKTIPWWKNEAETKGLVE